MITYELAKKLKDAGFPYSEYHDETRMIKELFIPTLSELIEACGERFHSLRRDKIIDTQVTAWGAFIHKFKDIDLEIYGQGSTPEEAVANLWLKLNNK